LWGPIFEELPKSKDQRAERGEVLRGGMFPSPPAKKSRWGSAVSSLSGVRGDFPVT